MLPEFSHANVSTLASEETDSMLFHAGGFNPRESVACPMAMATMKWGHKHFIPWKCNSVWYCYEKMSP
jgi:hypothetical protein